MYGQRDKDKFGSGTPASADGKPEYKVAGVALDWDTVPANATEATLPDGSKVPAGVKYIPFGCVIAEITATGKYGPFEDLATDGRDTAQRGKVFIVNYTLRDDDDPDHAGRSSGVCEGGRFFRLRLKILAAGAFTNTGAWTAIETVMPRVTPVDV